MPTKTSRYISSFACAGFILLGLQSGVVAVEPSGDFGSTSLSGGSMSTGPTWRDRMRDFSGKTSSSVSSWFASDEDRNIWYYLKDHLEIGARTTDFDLDETMRPADEMRELTYIGYVNQLEPQSDSSLKFHVTGVLNLSKQGPWCPDIALEWTEDEVAARTRNFNNGQTSDGIVRMSGPIYSLILRYPIRHERMTWIQAITPWFGYGQASWSAEFEPEAWWTRGWTTEEAFNRAGMPEGNRHSTTRVIEVTDDSSKVISWGIIVQITEYFAVDFMTREMDMVSNAQFFRNGALNRVGEFPLSHTATGFGSRFTF
ncbi:MAG: hypothetical protein O3A51_00130 [Verrucomicrobia bacterium]|nr:hypothetical protein [Verrucomicrobiota bacterium]